MEQPDVHRHIPQDQSGWMSKGNRIEYFCLHTLLKRHQAPEPPPTANLAGSRSSPTRPRRVRRGATRLAVGGASPAHRRGPPATASFARPPRPPRPAAWCSYPRYGDQCCARGGGGRDPGHASARRHGWASRCMHASWPVLRRAQRPPRRGRGPPLPPRVPHNPRPPRAQAAGDRVGRCSAPLVGNAAQPTGGAAG